MTTVLPLSAFWMIISLSTYDDFSILTTESNEFKLHLKESLLIKRDKPELNKNCYTHPLELFD